jgi:2-phospho-L-lactate guanylyltransferase
MSVRAIVPLKRPSEAKSRLAGAMSDEARRRLALAMAAHVIAVARTVVDEVFLLTPEPIAAFEGVPALFDAAEGLNASLDQAALRLPALPGDTLVVLHADLAVLEPADVAALVEAAARGVAIAPDRHATGVNAVAFRPPLDLRFCFGPGSRAGFEAGAVRLGRDPILVERPGLALDVDDAESLALYRQRLAAVG